MLTLARVTALADVRSTPVSRFSPQFNKDALTSTLSENHIVYGFLGNALGGRPKHPSMFTAGVADYDKMAAHPDFRAALVRLSEATERHRIAVMCAEADPLDCHRCLLVARAFAAEGKEVGHILSSGEIVTHAQIEDRLLMIEGLTDEVLLYQTREARLAEAYRSRGRRVAFNESDMKQPKLTA